MQVNGFEGVGEWGVGWGSGGVAFLGFPFPHFHRRQEEPAEEFQILGDLSELGGGGGPWLQSKGTF